MGTVTKMAKLTVWELQQVDKGDVLHMRSICCQLKSFWPKNRRLLRRQSPLLNKVTPKKLPDNKWSHGEGHSAERFHQRQNLPGGPKTL